MPGDARLGLILRIVVEADLPKIISASRQGGHLAREIFPRTGYFDGLLNYAGLSARCR